MIEAEKLSRNFLLIVLLGISILFFQMVGMFLMPVFLAAIFSGLTYPYYTRLVRLFKGNRGLSAFVYCLGMVVLISGPVAFVLDLVRSEAMNFYQNNELKMQELIQQVDSSIIPSLRESAFLQQIGFDIEKFDYMNYIRQAVQGVGKFLLGVLSRTREGFEILFQVIVMLFTMYYFYKDGHRLIKWAKYLSPLDDQHEDLMIERFISASRATIKGTLIIGITQGSLGALTLWLFGFSAPVLWGLVMIVLSIIPMVGAWGVLLPAGILELLSGNVWQGVTIILISSFVVGNIDNFMRPKLVGRDTGMHDLLIFFSTIGGLAMFGLMGFIVGPIIAVLFLTILNIYSIEFKEQLDKSSHITPEPATVPAETKAET